MDNRVPAQWAPVVPLEAMALRSNVPTARQIDEHPPTSTPASRLRRSFRILPLALALVASAVAGVAGAPPALAAPQATIEVIAGTGTQGTPTEGTATSSDMSRLASVAVDSQENAYVADVDNRYVYKVTPDGDLSIFAGTGAAGAPVPGPATSSPVSTPSGLAVDSDDNLYVTEPDSRHVLKVTPDGDLSIHAGDGTSGTPVPGPATSSPLGYPTALATDADDNLYVTDLSERVVLRVDSSGDLSIIAGDGTAGALTPGPATSSPISNPAGVAVDGDGNVYVSDSANYQVAKIDGNGDLSVYAGTGSNGALTPGPATASDFGLPQGLVTDSDGNLYIADSLSNRVAMVDTSGDLSIFAGDGTAAPPVAGPAVDSPLDFPYGLAIDAYDRVYIADWTNYVVERVTGTDTPEAPTSLHVDEGDEEFDIAFLPGDPGSSPVLWYEVSLDDCNTYATLSTTDGPGNSQVGTVTSLQNGVTYEVCVRAVNDIGEGAESVMVEVTPMASATVPGAPTKLRAAAKDRSARLWWKPPASNGGRPIRGYELDLHDNGHWVKLVIAAAPQGQRTAAITGLRNGGTYRPRVRAVNSIGAGAASAPTTVKPIAPKRRR